MTSKYFFTLGMVGTGLAMVALAQGCGGTTTGNTGSGTGGKSPTTSSTKATSSSTSMMTGPTSGSGGSGAGGGGTATNTSFSSAQPIMVDPMTATAGTLPDAMTSLYYSFTGKAGDFIEIQALAQALVMGTPTMPHDPNDETVTDTVVTLYLPDKATIWAQDDDAWPRVSTDSTLYTQLPMDGTYYFLVQDCNALAVNNPNVTCAPAANISDFNFQVAVIDLTALKADVVGSTSTPATITYKMPNGDKTDYGTYELDGDFAMQKDVHTFNFTPPSNTPSSDAAHTRNRAYFWVQPYGAGDGDGTAIDVVLTAKDMAGNVLAQADQEYYGNGDNPQDNAMQFSFPFDDQFGNALGSPFVLDVAVSNGTALQPMKSFYSIEHFEGGFEYGQPEAEGPKGSMMNDTAATAETLTSPSGVTGGFFIDGNISSPTDVDWFTATIPSTAKKYYIACEAARDGSGLQGFTAELMSSTSGATGTMTMLTPLGPEVANPKTDLQSNPMGTAIPTGATSVFLKISATGQSSTVAGTYYHCEIDLI